ncbi:hypothetical protein ACOMHN_044172 [Nucella lapillus]
MCQTTRKAASAGFHVRRLIRVVWWSSARDQSEEAASAAEAALEDGDGRPSRDDAPSNLRKVTRSLGRILKKDGNPIVPLSAPVDCGTPPRAVITAEHPHVPSLQRNTPTCRHYSGTPPRAVITAEHPHVPSLQRNTPTCRHYSGTPPRAVITAEHPHVPSLQRNTPTCRH